MSSNQLKQPPSSNSTGTSLSDSKDPNSSSEEILVAPTREIYNQYNELKNEYHQYMNKIMELELDRNEHILVEETLKPLDINRRAYRLMNEILVERTVGDVLPTVISNRINLDETLAILRQRLEETEQSVQELKKKYNLQDNPNNNNQQQ